MEWNQLEYFLTVARLQHVTRAAEELSITQPALSHSIGKLEEELGVPLFERSGRNVQLNRYGEVFAKRVEAAILEIRKGKQEIEELTNPESGTVALAFLHTLGNEFIPTLISSFRKRYPNIHFELYQGSNSFIIQKLENGASDFCITSPKINCDGMMWLPLITEELYVVVPKGHKLSGQREVDLHAFSEEPFIGLNTSCGFRSILDDIFQSAGFHPKVTFEAEDLSTAAGFVSAGLGVSLLPSTSGLKMDGTSWLTVKKTECTCTIGLAWKEKCYLSPAAKLFKEFCSHHFCEQN
ncbi:LysR family transcriptional regulator [Paenibacillus sp. KQZ6P-2]|uniref:LysR family transcriptional regulator n=1 Tax=Paenibacillus mangrovi TaxID=2931978 RepID=A0A9X1WX50_9BACL|nr:LysR family transcriptional regulator [Paenibacillus mangrovi]MCJ8013654.1 LysR family transcriptional regulator [Paenibacillus mangrovi]